MQLAWGFAEGLRVPGSVSIHGALAALAAPGRHLDGTLPHSHVIPDFLYTDVPLRDVSACSQTALRGGQARGAGSGKSGHART